MSVGARRAGSRAGRAWKEGCSGVARCAGVDGEGVDAAWNQRLQGIIYEAMTGHARPPFEAPAHHEDTEMAPFAGPRMAGVQVAVVAHLEGQRLQRGAQRGFDFGG
jgi:hypothetical protein